MMMPVLATPSGEGMPMVIPVLPSTFACLSPTMTPRGCSYLFRKSLSRDFLNFLGDSLGLGFGQGFAFRFTGLFEAVEELCPG